jgi:hypothetical protein
MGNTAPTGAAATAARPPVGVAVATKGGDNIHVTSTSEEERKFLEKMPHIEIVHNTGAGADHTFASEDLGSPRRHSWATSVTSITGFSNGSYGSRATIRKEKPQAQEQAAPTLQRMSLTPLQNGTPPSAPTPAAGGVTTTVTTCGQANGNNNNNDMNHSFRRNNTMTPSTVLMEKTTSSSGDGASAGTGRRTPQEMMIRAMTPSNENMNNKSSSSAATSNSKAASSAGTGAAIVSGVPPLVPKLSKMTSTTASSSASRASATEALLAEMQRKLAKVDQEQDSCLNQLTKMNEEMESYKGDMETKLREKEDIIEMHEANIAYLKQALLKCKAEHSTEKTRATQEMRSLLRKVSALRNQLLVSEQERDAAVAAFNRVEAAATATNTSEDEDQQSTGSSSGGGGGGGTRSSSASSVCISVTPNPEVEELRATVQELLQQLQDSEDEHQREQDMLQDEVMLLRKKMEQLEMDYIVVEKERDDARFAQKEAQQQLQVEKALNASDLKKYQDELAKWRTRYLQERQYAKKEKASSQHLLKRTAVLVGNRLGAGILEGMAEEVDEFEYADCHSSMMGEFHKTSSSGGSQQYQREQLQQHPTNIHIQTISSSADTSANNSIVQTATTANANHSLQGQQRQQTSSASTASGFVMAPSSNSSLGPLWTLPSPKPSQAFEETISIPGILSQVW